MSTSPDYNVIVRRTIERYRTFVQEAPRVEHQAPAGLSSWRKETPSSPHPYHFICFTSRLLFPPLFSRGALSLEVPRYRAHGSRGCAVAAAH